MTKRNHNRRVQEVLQDRTITRQHGVTRGCPLNKNVRCFHVFFIPAELPESLPESCFNEQTSKNCTFFRLRPLNTFLTNLLTKLTSHSSFQKSFSLREPLREMARKTRIHDIWISKTFHLSCQVQSYVLLMYRPKSNFLYILQMQS